MKTIMIDLHHNEKKHLYGKLKINENIDCKWDTVYNTEGRLAVEEIIPNSSGPSRRIRNAKSIEKLFGEFIAREMTKKYN